MEKSVTFEEALRRIEELEKENTELREELEYYRNRKLSGRQKHNAKWMAIYNDFVAGYESGMTMPLRYNNDKQKKPLFSRGLSVCRLLFNSFSKLKIDENYKEKRRLFY